MKFDIKRIIETRLLIQGASGSGKSTLARLLLEQSSGHVQQIIIDPEGEFSTLRQIGDYLLCAQDGDVRTDRKSAALLARRIRETGVSAIIDIYELKPVERHEFVARFLEGLLAAPKKYWRDALLFIDEAHVFAPQARSSDSLIAVQDMAARGRKRRLGLICATQRLSKLHKDVAAELQNRFIGQTGLKNDLRSAGDEMGLSYQEAREALVKLKPGQFWQFGPALAPEFQLVTFPLPKTKAATAETVPVHVSSDLAKVIELLADLPQQAAKEAKTLADLQSELAALKRENRGLKAGYGKPDAEVQRLVREAKQEAATAVRDAQQQNSQLAAQLKATGRALEQARTLAQKLCGALEIEKVEFKVEFTAPPINISPATVKRVLQKRPADAGNGSLSPPKQKLLDQLAWLELHGVYPPRKETLAAAAEVSPTSGGYFNNLGSLRSAGLIEYPQPGTVAFTDDGRALAHVPDDDRPVHERWLSVVKKPQQAILLALIDIHPEAITKDELAATIGVSPTSGGYFNNLGRLRTLGAVDYPQPGYVALTENVMPDGGR